MKCGCHGVPRRFAENTVLAGQLASTPCLRPQGSGTSRRGQGTPPPKGEINKHKDFGGDIELSACPGMASRTRRRDGLFFFTCSFKEGISTQFLLIPLGTLCSIVDLAEGTAHHTLRPCHSHAPRQTQHRRGGPSGAALLLLRLRMQNASMSRPRKHLPSPPPLPGRGNSPQPPAKSASQTPARSSPKAKMSSQPASRP